ncbi:MAG TPA: arylsulfatase [Terriglobales bacterium]|nr:arylsulfatase [Terriglobales bacterium]
MKKEAKNVRHEVYPKPEHRFSNAKIGLTYHDSKPDFPPLDKAPPHAPNVVIVLLDDVGYGWPSACGGLVRMPTAERLARQGLTYCQFHTTGLCAPTRAALLTGRNHHSVSTGIVQELATGFPGYCGILPRSCATIAEILSPSGYATGWWGKNHNTPDSHTSRAGPFTLWPTGRGFDYFYGFMGGETDQFYPALFRNTVPVQAPTGPDKGYHLTTDLADDCITWMRTQKAIAPDRPFFVHFATGGAHGPHQPPLGWRGRNAGRFEMGWDRYRQVVLARQLEMGVVVSGTRLTTRPAEIPSWESFSSDERLLFERQVENFADFLEHTDYEVGRLVQALGEIGELENTIFIYILGDNGSSAEGSIRGTISELAAMQGIEPPIEASLRRIEEIGLPGTSPHFAVGWAWAGDTPFQWVKQVASHFGATRNAMIISWPARIADAGTTRFQFHHVIDVVPTILDVIGIAEPTMVDGVAQKPMEGVSMSYTFDRANAKAKSARATQYFEMLGNRAIYYEGWIASCRHGRLPWVTKGTADFGDDRWELYNIEEDFSQSEDLAASHPEKLRELQERFLVEAGRRDVFPLDDRFAERMDTTLRPSFFGGRKEITLFPEMGRLPEGSAPKMNNVNHAIDVIAEIPEDGAEGVLVCLGGDTAGWSLFVEGDRLHYHYNWFTLERYDVVADEPLPRGRLVLRMEFECETPQTPGGPAVVRLLHNGRLVGQGRIEKQVPGKFGFESLDVGEDTMSPVYPGYRERLPFRFTGRIESVEFHLGEAATRTTEELVERHLQDY